MSIKGVSAVLIAAEATDHIYRNSTAASVQAEMKEAGWTNPDGFGFFFYHPEIVDATGLPITMPAEAALKIQRLWEERMEKKTEDAE
jgi:hypothetical protein